ncbi:MAG: hypothetical protein J5I98_18585, partial [Phaeodactylibacter sp.]|nr:hypothetical protein [Phaeodactylibacter sp.]
RIGKARRELAGLEKDLARLLRQNARLDKRQQEVFDQLKDLNQEDKEILAQILQTRFSIEAREREIESLKNIKAQ